MPIIQSAKKALRQTKKRTERNRAKKVALKKETKKLKSKADGETLSSIFSLADKLTKTGVIHKRKAARIKSKAARAVTGKKEEKPQNKARKKNKK
ncbi:30S ribosomal protein S20 [Patescibacteria group bacterium]|nr:30S ribosomal protein S20 [Patescibacteria group bacterium]